MPPQIYTLLWDYLPNTVIGLLGSPSKPSLLTLYTAKS